MSTWTPAAVAAVVLTACLGVGWAVTVAAVVWQDGPAQVSDLRYVAGLGQTLAGALGVFLGLSIGYRRNGKGAGNGHG